MFEDFLIASPLIILLVFVLLAAMLQTSEYLISASILFLCGLLFNMYLKYFFYVATTVWPNARVNRPSDCPNPTSNGCERCSILRSHRQEPLTGVEVLGLPSGHAQFMCIATALTYFSLRPWGQQAQFMGLIVMSIWTAAVCHQRIQSECHSFYQVGLGCLVGTSIGVVLVQLLSSSLDNFKLGL